MTHAANSIMGIAGALIMAAIFADLLFLGGCALMVYAGFKTIQHMRLKKLPAKKSTSRGLV